MADWFKLYENDLDNELIQWAMSECQPAGFVYVTILSRCCRDKSGTLAWTGQDFELFALARSAHITPPIANECLKLLEKIRYIEIGEKTLKVLNWNNRQSEYCQKKSKVSRHCPDTVPTKSGECPLRGEEIRRDKNRIEDLPLEVVFWNSQEKLPKVQAVSPDRKKFLKARRADPYFVEHFNEAVVKVTQSKFCMGINDKGWKADFDWMLRPGTVTKIMEGKYGERTPINGSNHTENSRNAGTAKPVTSVAETVRRRQAQAVARQVAEAANNPQLPLVGP